MANDDDRDTQPQPVGAAGGADWALSMAGRDTAESYLKEHTRLAREQAEVARLQAEELRREDALRHWSLRVRHISDVMKLAFELALAFIVVAAAMGVGAAIWSAANDKGLVIEAFSVPPDLAGRGLTGEVVAARLLDKLAALQAKTISNRAASSYANNWGGDIKLQIPDTGVSVGEFNRTLHAWLGHQTRITGEIYRVSSGLAVTARAGSDTSPSFTGSDADLDKLIQQAAESVYRATQPYRYAVYLMNANRVPESEQVFHALIANGSPQERAWAYIGLSNIYSARADFTRARAALESANALRPDFIMSAINLQNLDAQQQHDEAALASARRLVTLSLRHTERDISEGAWAFGVPIAQATLAGDVGDFETQVKFDREVEALPEFNNQVENALDGDVIAFGWMHDRAALESMLATLPATSNPQTVFQRSVTGAFADLIMGRWQTLLARRAQLDAHVAKLGAVGAAAAPRQLWPEIALAPADSGDFAAAHKLVDATPTDCTMCLRCRGWIDAQEKNWRGAAYWFSRAVRDAPSPPFAWTNWGEVLLAKGDVDGAIDKFREASLRGPHFADPLERWGEALMLKRRSDLALAKFEEANTYAPNWGRLHLKWGEALAYAGRAEDARRQFAIASALTLSPAEKAALARWHQRGM